ncbi:hypothetical protein B0A53_02515 [Rhodotorula sp. CCFEE 5036]|nr:hypothetical protein B0A53_02515 [Rhodotorula sp. CCFEE 5036]
MDVDVSTTSPSEWQYTQEGGANLVLSYRGGGADWTGYALRLRKRATERSTPNTTPESRVDPEDWGQSVVRPLLGGDQLYLQPRVARLDPQWLDQVSQMLHSQRARPREREQEDEIDPTARTAVLVKDLIAGQGVLSIELKPKWGFLPTLTHLSSTTAPIKATHCRTCMHRAYKRHLKKGKGKANVEEEEEGAGYCPLDLYSQDAGRVARAVRQLWTTWNASAGEANNLRFFLDGKLVKPGESSLKSILASLAPVTTDDKDPCEEGLIATLVPILLSSPVLPRLAALQASLDPLDIEGLVQRILVETGLDLYDDDHAKADDGGEVEQKLGGQPDVQEWREWLERWQQQQQTESAPNLDPDSKQHDDANAEASRGSIPITLRDQVLAYLLSATFKDCSVFIRLSGLAPSPSPPPSTRTMTSTAITPSSSAAAQPHQPRHNIKEDDEPLATTTAGACSPSVEIKVIDLDPKPLARLSKYAKMDRDLVQHWRRNEFVGYATDASKSAMSPPKLARWPEVGDRFTSLADFKLACFRFGASIGCELRVLKSERDNLYIEAVVTHVKAKASHSCDPNELERRRQSGQAAEAMRNRIAKFDGGAAAAPHKRRREIGVEGMSTTLSKKGTPLSYAGVDLKDYAPSGERAQLPTLSESFPSFDSALKLCRLYATSCEFWLDYRWQPDEEQYWLECTHGRKTRASSSSETCPYSIIIRQDWDGLWYRRPSKLDHNHAITHVEPTSALGDEPPTSSNICSASQSRPFQRENTRTTASPTSSFETASFAVPSTPAEVKKRSAAHLHTPSSSALAKKPRSSSNLSQPSDDLVAFAAGLRQSISAAAGGEAYQDAQALVALGVHSINDLVQLVCLAPSTVQAMIAECESGGRAEDVLTALLQART